MTPLPTFGQALAATLLQSLWQVAALGLAAAGVLAALHRAGAATRHAVGMAFLLAMVAAPAATFWQLHDVAAAPADLVAAMMPTLEPATAAATAARTAGTVAHAARVPSDDTAHRMAALVHATRLPDWIAALWAVGVTAMGLRLAGGWWLVRRLDRLPAQPLPPAWQARVARLQSRLGIARAVAFRVLPGGDQPFTTRCLRPVVWLPAALLTGLEVDQLEALVAHELAHVRRLDWLWNGLQCLVEALLFFHPAAWWLGARIRREREHACDDLAAVACGDPLVLAGALAQLERTRATQPRGTDRPGLTPRLALAAAGPRGNGVLERVARLVGAGAPRRRDRASLGGLALVLAVTAWAAHAVPVGAPSAGASAASGPSDDSVPVRPDAWYTYVGSSEHLRWRVDGHLRDYHHWYGVDGQPHETWRIDGQSLPVTTDVLAWIASQRPLPPPPPLPPLPPAPPTLAELPLPPSPPTPPALEDHPGVKALTLQLQRAPAVVARVGTPVQLSEDCGPCRLTDDELTLNLSVHGPKGAAYLKVEGHRQGNDWRFDRMDVRGM